MGTDLATVIGRNVKERRLARKMRQADLAATADTTEAAVSKIEAGRRMPTVPTLVALADALHTKLDDLVAD